MRGFSHITVIDHRPEEDAAAARRRIQEKRSGRDPRSLAVLPVLELQPWPHPRRRPRCRRARRTIRPPDRDADPALLEKLASDRGRWRQLDRPPAQRPPRHRPGVGRHGRLAARPRRPDAGTHAGRVVGQPAGDGRPPQGRRRRGRAAAPRSTRPTGASGNGALEPDAQVHPGRARPERRPPAARRQRRELGWGARRRAAAPHRAGQRRQHRDASRRRRAGRQAGARQVRRRSGREPQAGRPGWR